MADQSLYFRKTLHDLRLNSRFQTLVNLIVHLTNKLIFSTQSLSEQLCFVHFEVMCILALIFIDIIVITIISLVITIIIGFHIILTRGTVGFISYYHVELLVLTILLSGLAERSKETPAEHLSERVGLKTPSMGAELFWWWPSLLVLSLSDWWWHWSSWSLLWSQRSSWELTRSISLQYWSSPEVPSSYVDLCYFSCFLDQLWPPAKVVFYWSSPEVPSTATSCCVGWSFLPTMSFIWTGTIWTIQTIWACNVFYLNAILASRIFEIRVDVLVLTASVYFQRKDQTWNYIQRFKTLSQPYFDNYYIAMLETVSRFGKTSSPLPACPFFRFFLLQNYFYWG